VLLLGRASRFLPTVQAHFARVGGTVSAESVDVDVDVRSVTTGTSAYEALLAAADPFDAARYPVARYRSSRVRWDGARAVVDGVLDLRGRSAVVRLVGTCREQDDGAARLSATGRVDRRDFGLRLEVPGCGALVPSHLELAIDVTADPTD
jgi:polyisoprenoid-binding protein YceI